MKRKIIFIIVVVFAFCIGVTNFHQKTDHIVTINKVKKVKTIPLITQLIIGDNYNLALCDNGTVWSWGNNTEGKLGITASSATYPQKIEGLKNIVEVLDGEDIIFALDNTGSVYTWGKNIKYLFRQTDAKDNIVQEPVKIETLANITDIDAGSNRMFALDCAGNLYSLGIYLYRGDEGNEVQLLIPAQSELIADGVEKITAGACYYHYFIRKDSTFFSIMEYLNNSDGAPYAFIFPNIKNQKDQLSDGYYMPEDVEDMKILSESTKEGVTVYYNIDRVKEINAVSSDQYTVFVSKVDGTLMFWNSDRIKYHDNMFALVNPENGNESVHGVFEEIHFHNADKPHVIAMQSGKEHTIFLTEDGEVFYSRYVTCNVQDIDYYKRSNPDPSRIPSIRTVEDMEIKTITFHKLKLKDIIQIDSDKKNNFSAIDSKGNYYHIQFSNKS